MESHWSHFNPVKIVFERGCRSLLTTVLRKKTCLIVTSQGGRKRLGNDILFGTEIHASKHYWVDDVLENPDLKNLQKQINKIQDFQFEAVVAIGGGSVLDTGKVLALALSAECKSKSLLTLIEEASHFPYGVSLPLYALPTTAGTGSEVTPFATVWDKEKKRKLSLSGPSVFPNFAFVDYELTHSLPAETTLHSGLDSINQALESICSKNSTPLSEIYAQRSLLLGLNALPVLMDNLKDTNSRCSISESSLLAGLAISQTRTGLCHSISYPLTTHFGIPHGLAVAFTMPFMLKHNLTKEDRRFERLASVLNPNSEFCSTELVENFVQLNKRFKVAEKVKLKIRSLDALLDIQNEMFTPGRCDNGIAPVNEEIVKNILCDSWDSVN
jgi:alcohol dehydrogenase